MPLFGKSKGKQAKFDYYLLVHSLSPFPANYRSVYITWQRGSGKKGVTRTVGPAPEGPGRSWATYQFNEAFHVACTLNQDPKAQGNGGPYEKKWLILAIMDGDKSGKTGKDPLGRVVINLADYAADDDKATMSFTVAANKVISSDVGECKMLITLGCRSKGRPPMALGGRLMQSGGSADKGSVASSEYSDEDDSESSSLSPLGSQAMVRPLSKIPETNETRRGPKPGAYDADGFLVDDADEVLSATAFPKPLPQRKSVLPAQSQQPPPAPREPESDADSEDDFLAQAVAAMDGKAPMPVAPSRQQSSDRQPGIAPSVMAIASIGSSISAQQPRQRGVPPTPFNKPLASDASAKPSVGAARPAPLFALKPEGRPEPPPEVPEPQPELRSEPSFALMSAQQPDLDPPIPRGMPPAAASKRELRPQASRIGAPVGNGDSEGGPLPRRGVSRLVSQFEPGPGAAAVPRPQRLDSLQSLGSQVSVDEATTSGRGLEPKASSLQTQALRGLRSRPADGSFDEGDDGPDFGRDRIDRGPTSRVLAVEGDGGQGRGDSPRHRKLEASRRENRPDANSGMGLLLPGAVAVGAAAAVGSPVEQVTAETPLQQPAKHWLDEPEDLGVEESPGSSPVATPSYLEVAPAPLRRNLKNEPGPTMNTEPEVRGNKSQSSAVQLSDEVPDVEGRHLGTPSNEPPDPANPFLETNPFLVSEPVTEATEEPPLAAPPQPPPQLEQLPLFGARPEPRGVLDSPQEQPPAVQHPPLPAPVPLPVPVSALKQAASLAAAEKPPLAAPQSQRALPPMPVLQSQPVSVLPPSPPPVEPQREQVPEASASNGNLHGLAPLSSGQTNGDAAQAIEVLERELRAVAALEASVYLARSGKARGVRASSKARNVHAPARRLARTTISLGPEEGIIFGLRAIRAIEAAADGAGDIAGRAYWWSNCIQLRWMLWAMCHGSGPLEDGDPAADPDSEEFEWVMQVLVPPLRELESHIFQQLFNHLWASVLMEGVNADQLPGTQPKHWIIPPSKEEEAVQRWIDAFQTVHRALLPVGGSVTSGHITLLKAKTLTAIMRRLDSAVFDRLVSGEDSSGTMSRRDTFSTRRNESRGLSPEGELPLDGRLLPFAQSGGLSFGVGVNLKMAATRWTNWAADVGLRNDRGSPEEGYMLFPKLRATADLLMMPKEVLTDRAIRSEVVPGLPLHVICQLLARFQPDDLAREPLPPGLMEALQNETPPAQEPPSPTSQGLVGYEPPSEAALLADGLIEPVSLEMDAESEDELETLVEMYDPDRQGHSTERFGLLRELWASAR